MKNKLLAVLLIVVFIASISAVVAEDVADVSEEMSVSQEETNVVDENDDALAASSSEEDIAEPEEEYADSSGKTSVSVKVEVLDKNVKVGDTFKVKLTVTNQGLNPTEDLVVAFSFADVQQNLDTSFKLVDDGTVDVTEGDGGYIVDFGYLGAGETQDVILTFLATTSGDKYIFASASGSNVEENGLNYANTTFTVSEAGDVKEDVANVSKSMPAAGNPLALLALAILGILPYYRRKG
ncbi:hypothetical protein [Methanobrevibacter sp.]|uniref:hypothetical protein n=1 Tax=Methanobrevibacter sp. TaxID=66852 RepID=UPI003890BCD6